MNTAAIGIIIGIGLSFFFLYTRKKSWASPKRRWAICAVLFILGLFGLNNPPEPLEDNIILFRYLCLPMVYYATDRLFRHLSFNIYNRDFILWLNWSDEIDHTIGGSNPHVKVYDKVFSLGLLVIILLGAFLGVTLWP